MLKIEKYVTASPEQLEIVIEGMRNSYDSWDDSDSYIEYIENPETMNRAAWQFHLGEKDHDLMTRLNKGGSSEAKYRRMIPVWVDIVAPLYWWKEFDTYKVGTVGNSCSTMHRIAAKEFTMDDFSTENLASLGKQSVLPHVWEETYLIDYKDTMARTIDALNNAREKYLMYDKILKGLTLLNNEARDNLIHGRRVCWDQLIQLLPSSYNQKRTIKLNYEVLAKIYKERKHHKLDEWHVFCDWIEQLPYSDIITGKPEEKPSIVIDNFALKEAAAKATYKDLQKATRELY